MITTGQKLALLKLVGKCSRMARLYLVSRLIGREIASFNDLTVHDWQTIRDQAYPRWEQGDWETLDADFEALRFALAQEYLDQLLKTEAQF